MQTPTLQTLSRTCLLLACALALSGCAYWVRDKEQVLLVSGFQRQAVNTPQRRAELGSLPSHQFVRKDHGTQVSYTWADPLVCNCLWVGSEQQYKKYWTVLASRSGPSNAAPGTGSGYYPQPAPTFGYGTP